MALTLCADLSAADWIAHSDLPWSQLVGFGPAGFEAYARLRLLPDPDRPGQSENDVEAEEWRSDQLPRLFEVLAGHTATPEDCYFCVWEGFAGSTVPVDDEAVYLDEHTAAEVGDPGAVPALAPRPAVEPTPTLPQVVVPNRAYWLFRGRLSEVGAWDSAQGWPAELRLHEAEPAFVWPSDHAWCVALDVDPHWAGIGGSAALVTELTTDPRLDAVRADPGEAQPAYR